MKADDNVYPVPGLTARDYIAIEAMAGIWAFQGNQVYAGLDDETDFPTKLAIVSYEIADAMIKESSK
jgi:hypothetical protein